LSHHAGTALRIPHALDLIVSPPEPSQEFWSRLETTASSVEAKRNQNLWFDELPIQDDGTVYPVTYHMIHNDEEIRTQIMLNGDGDLAMLDMSFAEFAGLQRG